MYVTIAVLNIANVFSRSLNESSAETSVILQPKLRVAIKSNSLLMIYLIRTASSSNRHVAFKRKSR